MLASFLLVILMVCSPVLLSLGNPNSYALPTYSKSDPPPFGSPLDVWMTEWWKWWISTTKDDYPPPREGCLANNTGDMVMLMEPALTGVYYQKCEISSKQGIILPLWTAFQEDYGEYEGKSYQELSQAAREIGNLGRVISQVKLDGVPVANLNEESSMTGTSVQTDITSMENVVEVYSKGFNATIPENTWRDSQNTGQLFRNGAHGWFVFMQPLQPGNHTLYYSTSVDPTKKPPTASVEITYDVKVK